MISVKNVIFGWVSGLKEAKNDQKFAGEWDMVLLIMQ